ncbi:MAG: recombinase family protein [Erysipelotrichaceae bacterium]|nr:recombinase family protein [Erysipelotrichaceae bacterium]
MSGVFSELELRIIRERVRSGMANAKAKGSLIGRPRTTKDIPSLFYKYYPSFNRGTLNLSVLARICGISRTSCYKYLKIVGS